MQLKERGFSLIELLAIVTVVALLIALVLPALNRIQSRTQSFQCMNNLRQWGLATLRYALEHDDLLPKDGAPNGVSRNEGWYIDLPDMMGVPPYHEMTWRTNAAIDPGRSVWICPSNARRSNGNNLFHYCLNENVNGSGAGRQIPLRAVERPDATVWMFDNGRLAAVARQNNVHTNLHRRGAQFVFLDAHVERFEVKDYWDFAIDRGRTNHPSLSWFP